MLSRCIQAAILFKILTCQPTLYIRGVVLRLAVKARDCAIIGFPVVWIDQVLL